MDENAQTHINSISILQDQYTPIPPEGVGGSKRKRQAKTTPDWKPERFEKFWKFYPRGEDRQGAVKAWDKLTPDDELIDKMEIALSKQMLTDEWQRGIGIPYACRWINKRRWEDSAKQIPQGAAPQRQGGKVMEGLSEWE